MLCHLGNFEVFVPFLPKKMCHFGKNGTIDLTLKRKQPPTKALIRLGNLTRGRCPDLFPAFWHCQCRDNLDPANSPLLSSRSTPSPTPSIVHTAGVIKITVRKQTNISPFCSVAILNFSFIAAIPSVGGCHWVHNYNIKKHDKHLGFFSGYFNFRTSGSWDPLPGFGLGKPCVHEFLDWTKELGKSE
jgi:hypothetical protein